MNFFKSAHFILTLFFLVCVIAFFTAIKATLSLNARAESLQQEVLRLEETITPLRFKITARTAGSISLEVRFYDLSGRECGKRSLTVPGRELHIDVSVVSMPALQGAEGKNAYLFFPYAVFSEQIAAEDGFSLLGAYEADGFPALYSGGENKAALSPASGAELSSLFSRIKAGDSTAKDFGSSVHDIKEITGFKLGAVYTVLCHPHTGGVEIVQGK